MAIEVNQVLAIVRAVEDGAVWVEPEQGGCGRCHEPGGCGGQQLTQIFCITPRRYRVVHATPLQPGERVRLHLRAGAVSRLANLVYVFPLLCLLLGAALGMALAGDLGAMLSGLLALLLAIFAVRFFVARRLGNPDWHPYIQSGINDQV